MENQDEVFSVVEDPRQLAMQLVIGKNVWLTRSRWLYTFFVFVFFLVQRFIGETEVIHLDDIALLTLLSVFGNFIFLSVLRRNARLSPEKIDLVGPGKLVFLQLDFDLMVLSLMIFFSGGFNSPVIVLYIFHIIIATFLLEHRDALRKMLLTMVLVVVFFLMDESSLLSSPRIATMAAFDVVLFFSYLISAFLSHHLKENEYKLQELLGKFRELSVTDGLTNLYNQTHFFLLLNLQMERSKRYNSSFAIIIFDVDNFKNFNDNNGHIKGSETLKQVGILMKKVFRTTDVLAKYGGDEFVILLPNSDKVGALLGAERLRELVEATRFDGGEKQPQGRLTISLGIASYPEHGSTTQDVLDKADKALYVAKSSGKNRTIIYTLDLEEDL